MGYSTIVSFHEPHTFGESRSNPPWQQAMADELLALEKSHTLDLIDLSPEKWAIGRKWVYKIKTKEYGIVERYKATLIAKGFT